MPDMPQPSSVFSYDEHARSCDPNDFLKQTKRTINGIPVAPEQIEMIIKQIQRVLDLSSGDCLMEIACGNGYISKNLFQDIKYYLGSDISEYLISIARLNFEKVPDFNFKHADALQTIQTEKDPDKFNKFLCYAGIQYFNDAELIEILKLIKKHFKNIDRIFFGNIPNKEAAKSYFKTELPSEEEMSSTRTALGCWRSKSEISFIAQEAGWKATFHAMPEAFTGSAYRFDVLLTAGD